MQGTVIRRATTSDSAAIARLLRRSISELCREDHHDDLLIVEAWTANKTASNVNLWVTSASNVALVAERGSDVVGFGLLNTAGSVTLLYVSPEWRFQNVSKQLLAALEQTAVSLRLTRLTLNSTRTAYRFYTRAGFVADGESISGGAGRSVYPMHKILTDVERE